MPSGSMSLASASVPAPPGVFATSMPPDLSSEERESTSERSLHHSIMVNGTVLSPSLGTSGNPSKSPHFVMVREEDGTSYKHPNKIRKRNKSGRRSLHSSKGSTDARYLNGSQSPQYGSLSSGNKPLKVTIRRTALSHTLDNRKTTCNPDHDAYSSSSPSNSVIYSSSSSSSHCVLKAAEDDHPISVTPKPTSQSGNPSLSGAPSPSSSSLNLKSVEAAGADLISTSPSIHSSVEPPTQPSKRDASTSTRDCATITEPDLLGPCEPGSKIVLEGIVWLETPGCSIVLWAKSREIYCPTSLACKRLDSSFVSLPFKLLRLCIWSALRPLDLRARAPGNRCRFALPCRVHSQAYLSLARSRRNFCGSSPFVTRSSSPVGSGSSGPALNGLPMITLSAHINAHFPFWTYLDGRVGRAGGRVVAKGTISMTHTPPPPVPRVRRRARRFREDTAVETCAAACTCALSHTVSFAGALASLVVSNVAFGVRLFSEQLSLALQDGGHSALHFA
ncbi:unnamed protein product [Schistocephalus solidus]|uniref:ANK_REP_REGION domain-containing protein n=1 Tax=Schistocephalus solidus TaxID=70667 RepID=A0A183T083_SCHSO|nr:unnamed protein product [Schistocephalus solidus]